MSKPRTPCRMPPHLTRGDCNAERCRLRSPQRCSHKAIARCVPRFSVQRPPAARGETP